MEKDPTVLKTILEKRKKEELEKKGMIVSFIKVCDLLEIFLLPLYFLWFL
jgi:hypothetical protein